MSRSGQECLPAGAFVVRYRLELVRRGGELSEGPLIDRPAAALPWLLPVIARRDRLILGAIYCDAAGRALGLSVPYVGTRTRLMIEPRGIFVPALLARATTVMVFRNQVDGHPGANDDDIDRLGQLARAGAVLGVGLTDYLILDERGRCVSVRPPTAAIADVTDRLVLRP